MSVTTWKYRTGSVEIEVQRAAFSDALEAFVPALNAVAESAAAAARDALPEKHRKFVGVKTVADRGKWVLEARSRRWGSNPFGRGLEVPVALVTVNSALAMTWEYGTVPTAADVLVVTRSRSGELASVYTAHYQPLAKGAAAARARAVMRYRKPRRAR